MNVEPYWLDFRKYVDVYFFSNDISLGSKIVVFLLCFIFVYFLVVGIWQAIAIYPSIKLIKKLTTPDLLQSFSSKAENYRNQEVNGSPYALYLDLLKKNKISSGNSSAKIIISHLQSIFVSGCREATLDPTSLLRHTEHQLFKGTARLKNVLGSFIILGLLGTLLGLALSLEQLPTDLTSNGANSNELLVSLQSLVIHLKYAFVPSVLGIFFTLLGFVFYGSLVNSVFNPLKGELEKSTINFWVPYIFPAYSQKLIEKLESNASRMDAHFKDITAVAHFASQINQETGDFKQNLEKGNQLVKEIQSQAGSIEVISESLRKNFAEKLETFSEEFSATVKDLTASQSEFIKLQSNTETSLVEFKEILLLSSQKQEKNDERVQETIRYALEQHNSFSGNIGKNITDLNIEISKVLSTLKQNESVYIEKFNLQNDLVNNLVKEVSTNVKSEAINNRIVAEQILASSTDSFANIDTTLKSGLNDILIKFDRYDAPINDASKHIRDTYEGFINLITQVINENNARIETSQKSVKDAIVEHMTRLNSSLDQERGAMSKQTKELSDLTRAIVSLNENMNKPIWKRLFS